MTKQDAKKLALEIINYRLEHPEIKRKEDYPQFLFDKVKGFPNNCPMCNLFFVKDGKVLCPDCPLRVQRRIPKVGCNDWSKKGAKQKLAIIQAWDV
jgi:uncharacterized Zn finger protein (UPF0148 family)